MKPKHKNKQIQNFTPLKILSIKEKQKIVSMLNEQFGISRLDGLIVQKGRERLFLYLGSLSPRQIKDLERHVIIERVGVYFAKLVVDNNEEKIRLSIEGSQLLQSQIKKNIFQLDKQQAEEWMKGRQLDLSPESKGFLIITHKGDFLGTGKASENKIGNFIPKSRRLREKLT